MRSIILCVLPALLATATPGCSGDARAPGSEESLTTPAGDVLGTIHATVDGTERTWYVVTGDAKGKPYSSAMWLEMNGTRVVSLGGFDSEHPPIETFAVDPAAGDLSFGTYSGSTVQLLISAGDGEHSAKVTLPAARDQHFSLAYMPVAQTDDMVAGSFLMQEGSINVSDVSFSDGMASVRGTFQGTLQKLDGSGRMRVEHGQFEVTRIPRGSGPGSTGGKG